MTKKSKMNLSKKFLLWVWIKLLFYVNKYTSLNMSLVGMFLKYRKEILILELVNQYLPIKLRIFICSFWEMKISFFLFPQNNICNIWPIIQNYTIRIFFIQKILNWIKQWKKVAIQFFLLIDFSSSKDSNVKGSNSIFFFIFYLQTVELIL